MAEYCREVQEWIEEKVEKPIEEWVKKEEKKCKKKKCKKWCLCCNKWFCWIETFFVKVVKWVIVTVGKWVTRVVCEAVAGALNIAAVVLGLVFAIPILGRLLREIWDILVEIFWRLVGLLGLFLDLLGIELRKRLRICIIVLTEDRDGKEVPVSTLALLQPHIDSAKRIYLDQANVALIVDHIHTTDTPAPEANLDVSCGAGAWGDDLWVTGSWFEIAANDYCFDGAGQRLIGWAAPVVVFVVREVGGAGKKGCSLGPFADYVTIEGSDPICLAHEVGHACSLWHVSAADNLMNPKCGRTKLKKWQRVILRNSRHVTYL